MQMKSQVAFPSTTIIELSSETTVFPSSLYVFPFPIYFMKFSRAQAGSYFLSSFTQLTWMQLKTLLTANKIHSHVLSDESGMLMKEQFKRDQGTRPINVCTTTHLFVFIVTSCHLNPTLLLPYLLMPHTDHSCGLRVWMTPQGNRFTSSCCGRSI